MSKEFLSEDQLVERFQSDPSFGWLGYINHHSQELIDDYANYCSEHSLSSDSESSAKQFMEEREKLFNESIEN